ncbi:type IX secretion system sortase PorU [Marinoscillum sp. MHG1-6]|uniref:type IX secretion system sortase PorU n=1 Tax=Marinoscillum sp. MHG1-6 TaxID=2959627 RepID=UPI00215743F6|nr:type IX secretion system sortase PorU [Marinoscillum sp. MHG1-6]
MRAFLFFTVTLIFYVSHAQSVLSEGPWFKIGITENGAYKLDRNFFANQLKVDPASIDPRTVKLYGHAGGGPLPQANSIFRYDDPPENAIVAVGENDGIFNEGDYFLFYGNSPDKLKLQEDGSLDFVNNPYSDTTYYLLTFGGTVGIRAGAIPAGSPAGTPITEFDDYIAHKSEEDNILNSGRIWYSFPLTTSFGGDISKAFQYSVPGIQDSIGIKMNLLGASLFDASFDIFLNSSLLANQLVSPILDQTYVDRAIEYPLDFTIDNNTSESLSLLFYFNENRVNGRNSAGHIDYFYLGFKRTLALYDDQMQFRSRQAIGNTATYNLNSLGKSNVAIWNITDPINPKVQAYNQNGNTISFTESNAGLLSEYIAFQVNTCPTPKASGSIANQNLKANVDVDAIIVSAPEFLSEAQRLADFHASYDGLSVKVVTTRQIYNEFASGMQDLTAIRDYLKYVYDQGAQLRYALLFGDASFDYKGLDDRLKKENFVPVYESRESIHKLYSHSSDDYYGFFEEDEGDWYEGDQYPSGTPIPGTYVDHTLEIGVGRIPVHSLEDATNVVNKIIRYSTSKNAFGSWRTAVAYMADDGDGNQHMEDSEKLNQILFDDHPQYNAKRLYIDNFQQPDRQSPDMRAAIKKRLEDGVLILDYLGHGGNNDLMQESVVDRLWISDLTNRHKLPLFVTATCIFGVYDDPSTSLEKSGGERLLTHPNGGAIALLSTTRAVFAHTNYPVNEAFHNAAFQRIKGEYPRLGDIVRITKNNSLRGPINRNFALLGDPMLRLNYPEYEIRFDSLESDTLSALGTYTLTGNVYLDSSTVDNDFNGYASITVWDIPRKKITLGLDNPTYGSIEGEVNDPFQYSEQDNALFRGEVSITNGSFEVSFVLPKNSSYKYQKGKITAYAMADNQLLDANGGARDFVIGGTGEFEIDNTPPEISLYLNDPSFQNGDVVGPSSLFIAELSDNNGINISTNGFNQNLTLTLNDTLTLELNDYYTASRDDYTTGKIVYPINNLPAGRYHGELKVWDTHNNYTIKSVDFKVSDKPRISLFNVMNFPNPVASDGSTTFAFEHDRLGEGLTVIVDLYDQWGGKVNKWTFAIDDANLEVDDLTVLMTNNNGDRVKNGMYFYRLKVISTIDGANNEVIQRLLINN